MTGIDFPVMVNTRIIQAAFGEEVDRVPVWIMRQAGRYLPEFKELRSKYDFFSIVRTPELAAEVTLMPIKRFDVDAAIIFSDILVIPQALDMIVEMKPGIGPVLPKPITDPLNLREINWNIDVKHKLHYVYKAITLTRLQLEGKVPLIGFSGAPWTLMCYMVEGSGSKTVSNAKKWLYTYPVGSALLLKNLTKIIITYLVEQVRAGAQLLQVFESHAENLNKELFEEYSLPYLKVICKEVKSQLQSYKIEPVPMIVFAKGAHYALDTLSTSGYDVVGIDWTIEPEVARNALGPDVTIQGNLDPCSLYYTEGVEEAVISMAQKFKKHRYIANLGHGIYPDTPVESVKKMVDAIHSL